YHQSSTLFKMFLPLWVICIDNANNNISVLSPPVDIVPFSALFVNSGFETSPAENWRDHKIFDGFYSRADVSVVDVLVPSRRSRRIDF
ncbi:MAG: hypothetical protein LBI36_03770, partial [Oscillospiraceae bacterium]|nr:hypothetical protein [Oscillospiraceae bacterium]